jgi:hypothetical protein
MPLHSIKKTRFDSLALKGLAGSLLLGALLLGCSSAQKSSPSLSTAPQSVDKVNLLAAPIALNLDGIPGGDAIAVKIYATNSRNPKPVAITTGTLDLLAFDGILAASTNTPQPFKIWSFPASELRRLQFKASIGIGYQITASYLGLKPKSDKLTILARYLREDGQPIYSSPSTISLTAN